MMQVKNTDRHVFAEEIAVSVWFKIADHIVTVHIRNMLRDKNR